MCLRNRVAAQLRMSPYLNVDLREIGQANEPSYINKFEPMLHAIWLRQDGSCVQTCKNSHLDNADKFV